MVKNSTTAPTKKGPMRSYPKVAERLNVSVFSVRRIVGRGEIVAITVGGLQRIEDEEMEDYIRRQRARALRAALDKDE